MGGMERLKTIAGWGLFSVNEPVEMATGQPDETAAKSGADTRLVELLKLLEEMPDREDRRTDRDVWRDLSLAVTLYARTVNLWVRHVAERAHGAVILHLRDPASLRRASVTLGRVCDRCAHTTREAMDHILPALQRRSHGNVGDFQELLDQFDLELQAYSNRLAAHQRAANQRDGQGAA
jgi:hypothetical protein